MVRVPMMAHGTSLPRNHDVPSAPVSETTLASDGVPDSGPVLTDASRAASPVLDGDWPTLAVLSRRYIDRALEHTRGNKTRAADLLGIDRRTLNRILARERARRAAGAKAAG